MQVSETRSGNATILRIAGRVDSSVAKTLEQKVTELAGRDGSIIVDLREMNYVSSAGLRSFIILAKHARAKSQTIALSGMNEEVSEIFEISNLLELFTVFDTVEAAIAAQAR